jgi:aspartyl-tRNA(Asn)/glutamyl-tRNA(Gln) amidotransferase subunit A
MMTVDLDGARKTAEDIDQRTAKGEWPGLLAGMTLAIKDNIDTAGLETTSGSNFFKGRVPNRDAPVVSRLKQAGGVIVGKATLHEVCFGVRSHNALIGQCRNPYDTSIIPGGSSGGSAVAVATGMADGALGSDTGGSVRIPASICGVTGLRPTSGRIPNTGSLAVSESHDTIGPMARSALDVARLFAVMAGYDDGDPLSVDKPLENFLPQMGAGVGGLTIGLPRAYFYDDLDPEVASAVEEALKTFESLGATLRDIDLPGAAETFDQAATIIFSDAAALHAERLEQPAKWGQQTIERLRMGLEFSGTD